MTFKEFKIRLKHGINKMDEEIEDLLEVYNFSRSNKISFGNDLNKDRFNNIFGYDRIDKLRTDKRSKEYLLGSMDLALAGETRAKLMTLYITKYLKKSSVKDKEILTYNEKKILEELTNV
jgi:hypothetical protein